MNDARNQPSNQAIMLPRPIIDIYDADIDIPTLLRDIDIDIDPQSYHTIDTILTQNTNHAHITVDMIAILDKLMATEIIDIVLKSPCNRVTAAIINHDSSDREIINAYANGYNVVYNNSLYVSHNLPAAIKNNLHIKSANGALISDDIISSCTAIEQLYTNESCNITDCNRFAKTLRKLSATNTPCKEYDIASNKYVNKHNKINDRAIRKCTGITHLDASCNKFITTCSPFAKNLCKLEARDECGISDKGLTSCKSIVHLDASCNRNITTCKPFAKSLLILDMTSNCGITNKGLELCTNLRELYIDDGAEYITCDTFAHSLRKLKAYVSHEQRFDDVSIAKCHFITELDVSQNPFITTCAPFASSLRILSANCNQCGISDNGLRLCKHIEELHAYNNPKITTCEPFAKSLIHLSASSTSFMTHHDSPCGITDTGLRLCIAIEKLNAGGNDKITTCVPFARTLRELIASDDCGITNDGLRLCANITKINIDNNTHISSCKSFAKSLRKISMRLHWKLLREIDNVDVNDDTLRFCNNIVNLNAENCSLITSCTSFARTLRKLVACGSCGISDNGLYLCDAIEELDASGNEKITSCAPFANTLRILYATDSSGICDDGLKQCRLIQELDATDNANITTCAPFAKSLVELWANGKKCGISDKGLHMCTSIEVLKIVYNRKITTFAPFANSLMELYISKKMAHLVDRKLCFALEKVIVVDSSTTATTYDTDSNIDNNTYRNRVTDIWHDSDIKTMVVMLAIMIATFALIQLPILMDIPMEIPAAIQQLIQIAIKVIILLLIPIIIITDYNRIKK